MEKQLGKIQNVEFGIGGYNDIMVGISFTLGGPGWGVCDFWGYNRTEWSSSCKWSEQERNVELGKMCLKISKLLEDAKVDSVSKLIGKPIEAEVDIGKPLKSWRILTEVL